MENVQRPRSWSYGISRIVETYPDITGETVLYQLALSKNPVTRVEMVAHRDLIDVALQESPEPAVYPESPAPVVSAKE